MIITVEIKTCNDCKHGSHTGQFTKGGAKPCCNHDETVKSKGYGCFKRVIPYANVWDELINRNIRLAVKIPKWCPIKNGEKY